MNKIPSRIYSSFFALVFLLNIFPAYALKKPKALKHEFKLSTDSLITLVQISGKERYYMFVVHPQYAKDALNYWNQSVDERKAELADKYSNKGNGSKYQFEIKRSRYKKHSRAWWENDKYVSFVVYPVVTYEPGLINNEFHLNSGNPKSAYIRNKKTKELLCRPIASHKLSTDNYQYIRNVYGLNTSDDISFSKVNLANGAFPPNYPFDMEGFPMVFKFDPKCVLEKKSEFVLETTVAEIDNDLNSFIRKAIKKDFGLE